MSALIFCFAIGLIIGAAIAWRVCKKVYLRAFKEQLAEMQGELPYPKMLLDEDHDGHVVIRDGNVVECSMKWRSEFPDCTFTDGRYGIYLDGEPNWFGPESERPTEEASQAAELNGFASIFRPAA